MGHAEIDDLIDLRRERAPIGRRGFVDREPRRDREADAQAGLVDE